MLQSAQLPSVSGVDSKLGLTMVRPSLQSAPEPPALDPPRISKSCTPDMRQWRSVTLSWPLTFSTENWHTYIVNREYNCVSTTTRLRYVVYDDTTTHSTTTEVIEITIRLRYDYDPTTTYRARLLPFDAIRREQKIIMSIFRRIVVS